MKILLEKNILLENLSLATRFTSQKTTTTQILQGVLIKGDKKEIHFHSSNLNNYFHSKIKRPLEEEFNILVDPQRLIEFLSLLQSGEITLEVTEKKITISQKKTTGSFPLLVPGDFPFPPKTNKNKQILKTKDFFNSLSLILFSAAKDEGRPVLTGVNFVAEKELIMVTTDGFRLSLVRVEKQLDHPSFIAPSGFLEEVIKLATGEETVLFSYNEEEKIIVFELGSTTVYSRLIEGDFPPFGKVIPEKRETMVTVGKDELLRAIKLISIFAKEQSNIIVFDFKKEKLVIRPKTQEKEDITEIEIKLIGEEQTVAFNYRFLIDFLNRVPENKKNILIEVLRPDAPVVFRVEEKTNFLHIIMPVRIQEE